MAKPAVKDGLHPLIEDLSHIVGASNVLWGEAEGLAYENDAYPLERAKPLCTVLPGSADEVVAVVKACSAARIPFAPRGAGTGLAGGTILAGGVLVGLSRLNRILEIDLRNRRITVEAGAVNIDLSRAAAADGLLFAPDPSSQGASTIGGNIATNAGGPHTLKHGVTVNHLMSVDLVLPDGELITLGDKTEDVNGYDLLAMVCGGEGTLGIVTRATLRLTPLPEGVETVLVIFDSVVDCTQTVSAVMSSGITPAALEMMDSEILRTVEQAFHFGFPLDAAAVLIIELDGQTASLSRQVMAIKDVCEAHDSREVRQARSLSERAEIWSARKKAIGTLGRTSPGIVTQDGVIPRSKLPEVLSEISDIGKRHGLRIANVFHAGDGNLHPAVLFDPSKPGEVEKVKLANHDILELCISVGGTITGEHGVGLEKRDFMALLYPAATLETMRRVRSCFNPEELCNPGKVLPDSHGCAFEFAAPTRRIAS
jgi:glycolate oxidase subunit GlcD